MRSQKINNRSPRPFKSKTDRWSGGHDSKSFIPAPKPALRIVKSDAAAKKSQSTPQAETPPAVGDQK